VILRKVTHLGGARVTIGASLVLFAAGEYKLGVATGLANALSHIVVQILKRTVARGRPCDASGHPLALIDLPDPFSFPSGHAAATVAIASTVTWVHPWAGIIALPAALLVAYSRVALRVHHTSDVLAGIALGCAGAIAAVAFLF
jgi:undecaprenyl-diphosphatase